MQLRRAFLSAAITLLARAPLAAQAREPHAAQPERPTVATHAGIVPLTGPQPHAIYAGLVYNVGRL